MNDKEKRLVDISTLTGVWGLDTEFGFELSKQQFWDSVRLRYDWEISNLPTSCPCDSKFDIQHSMSYKKGGFLCIRHNDLRDQTANMISEMCQDTEIEPKLTPSPVEELQDRTSNNSIKERVDIRTQSFWEQGQQIFFDFFGFSTRMSVVVATSLCSSTML